MLSGASAGVTGSRADTQVSRELVESDPEKARKIITSGRRFPRTGHDRARWESVDWDEYRASIGVFGRQGPWRVGMAESKADSPDEWLCVAQGMPFKAGWYTTLEHDERGLVMSDLPAEIAGCLPFTDRVAAEKPASILIGGLGLGIVPRWLLANTAVAHIDVVEYDADVIELITTDACYRDWADPHRLFVHHGDVLTWEPPHAGRWEAAWFDIWDTVSAANLPSMEALAERYGPVTGWHLSWERPECEAMAERLLASHHVSVRGDTSVIACVEGQITTWEGE